jgi:Arc/MetJ-type ribon-helix-helix transcriptional regulator
MPGEAVRDGLRVVLDHHDDIIRIIRELPLLSEKEIESRTRYVDGFFEAAANEDKLLARFESRCL